MRAFLALFIFVVSHARVCDKYATEAEVLKSTDKDTVTEDCIIELIDNGWFDGAGLKLIHAVSSGIDLSEMVKIKATSAMHKMDKVLETISRDEVIMADMQPAFRWAQSGNEIFMEVKFSHRMDSPGCNEIHDSNVEFSERGLIVTGNCSISNTRFKAELNLEFFKELIPEECTFEKLPLGKIFVTLKKKKGKRAWARLLKGKDKPKNMGIWWEM